MITVKHVRNDGAFVGGKKVVEEADSGHYTEDRASKIYFKNGCEL